MVGGSDGPLAGLWLGWTVAQANQDCPYNDSCDAQAEPYPLQWTKSTPLPGTDQVHRHDARDDEGAKCDEGYAELSLGDHSAYIIAC